MLLECHTEQEERGLHGGVARTSQAARQAAHGEGVVVNLGSVSSLFQIQSESELCGFALKLPGCLTIHVLERANRGTL
jgi:hypothetical protein